MNPFEYQEDCGACGERVDILDNFCRDCGVKLPYLTPDQRVDSAVYDAIARDNNTLAWIRTSIGMAEKAVEMSLQRLRKAGYIQYIKSGPEYGWRIR